MEEKISISLDEVNSSKVDAELHRQDVQNRMAAHQDKIKVNFASSNVNYSQSGGFFRKAIVYMTIFSFIFSVLGWGIGELVINCENNDYYVALSIVKDVLRKNPQITNNELRTKLRELQYKFPELQNNQYLPYKVIEMNDTEHQEARKKTDSENRFWLTIWYVLLGVFISVGLAIAEPLSNKNSDSAISNAFIGAIFGGLGGFVVSLFIDNIYFALGGGGAISFVQIFARAVGWSILGAFLAIAPGIVMQSGKKFFLGLIGGAIGGAIGGILFDPICYIWDSVSLARFVNIVGLGVGAAIATVFLENVAKQGWLKVAAGIIKGKQFILYRNPTVIGSSPKCEIYLFKDPTVAPKHAAINNQNGNFIITAIEGATVWVNDVPVKQQKLKSNDQIKIGNTIFIFEARDIKQ